jgi:Mrp family chromosome partitioning ATPase
VLDLLVAGTLPPDPGEFVGIAKVAHVLDHLRTTHDLVILDTPPALLVGDTAVLSARADGIVVVARANVLRRPILAELRRLLRTLPASKLGYVVTGENEVASYGYGRAYGARQDGPPPSTQGAEQLQPSVTEAAGGVRSV